VHIEWLSLINKIKMLILIFKSSKFQSSSYHHSNHHHEDNLLDPCLQMVQICGTMDVFEETSELSKFQSSFSASIFEFKYLINQASRLSQFGRAPFLEEDLPDLHTSSI
jgi:hypothetical protein